MKRPIAVAVVSVLLDGTGVAIGAFALSGDVSGATTWGFGH